MPNVSPKGLWARIPGSSGAPAEPVSLHATLPTETTPRAVIEVWASGADGVPHLVWIAGPTPPSGVSAAYSAGAVTISWTVPTPANVTSYEVKRPNGTIVGTVSGSTTSIVDSSPVAMVGSYSVRGVLSGQYSDPAYSNSLDLTSGPVGLAASYSSSTNRTTLTWSAPGLGTPTRYEIYRGSTYLGYVSGSTLSYVDTSVFAGQNHTYTVTAKINSATAGSASVNVAVPARPPRLVWLVGPSFYYPERAWDSYGTGVFGHYLDWAPPDGGSWTGYEVQRYVSSWFAAGTTTKDAFGPYASSNTEKCRIRTLSSGGPSDWVESNFHAPEY